MLLSVGLGILRHYIFRSSSDHRNDDLDKAPCHRRRRGINYRPNVLFFQRGTYGVIFNDIIALGTSVLIDHTVRRLQYSAVL